MSRRQIAKALGVSPSQIQKDVHKVHENDQKVHAQRQARELQNKQELAKPRANGTPDAPRAHVGRDAERGTFKNILVRYFLIAWPMRTSCFWHQLDLGADAAPALGDDLRVYLSAEDSCLSA
jgi:hypothetical protein